MIADTMPLWAPTPLILPSQAKVARPYQTACLQAIKDHWAAGVNRVLCVLATGTGKTYCVAHLLEALEKKRMLVLVHGRRLIEQMANHVAAENPNLSVQVEQASNYADHDANVVVASIDTVGRTGSVRLDRFGGFDVVANDEAHRSLSEVWTRTLRKVADAGTLLSGWTATPFRGDKRKLSDLYDEVVFELSLRDAIEQGYLCRLRAIKVRTSTDISGVRSHKGEWGTDFDTEELAHKINVDERNSVIISAIEDHATDRKSILVHAANVEHIQALTDQLRGRGHAADGIHYKLPQKERDAALHRFHTGESRLLVHCGICLEGYDEPRIDAAVFAKPTKSRLYYYQALGRMTRLSPDTGKTDALAIDVVDVCRRARLMSASKAFGVRDIDVLGEDVLEAVQTADRAAAAGVEVEDGDSVKTIRNREKRAALRTVKIATQAAPVDLFGPPQTSTYQAPTRTQSVFPWLSVGDKGQQVLQVDRGSWAVVGRNNTGCWQITLTNDSGTEIAGEALTSTAFADPDWQKADAFVRRHAGHWQPPGYRPRNAFDKGISRAKFLRSDAPSRWKPATPAQIHAITRWRQVPPAGLTFGAASDWLSKLIYEARHRA